MITSPYEIRQPLPRLTFLDSIAEYIKTGKAIEFTIHWEDGTYIHWELSGPSKRDA